MWTEPRFWFRCPGIREGDLVTVHVGSVIPVRRNVSDRGSHG